MLVYNDAGNMANERAGDVARDMAKQTRELMESLFQTGMTTLEARALLGYIQAQIETEVIMCILQRQLLDNIEPVDVNVYAKTPLCLDKGCLHKKECANHTTAGDYRLEDGPTPDLARTPSGWSCSRSLTEQARGAILTNGSFAGDWRYND
jgi:hypothetical protein